PVMIAQYPVPPPLVTTCVTFDNVPLPPIPTTATGATRDVVVPSPSEPRLLFPQQSTWPVSRSAQLPPPSLASCVTFDSVPLPPTRTTGSGYGAHGNSPHVAGPPVVPLPSSSRKLSPQQSTPPALVSTHAPATVGSRSVTLPSKPLLPMP